MDRYQNVIIGHYQLLSLLGKGHVGEVWLATDIQMQRQVAIKLFPVVLSNDSQSLRDFADEARACAALIHPLILAIHDYGIHERAEGQLLPYLVMPYVPGGTLREYLVVTHGSRSVQKCLHYLRQAALALDYAHSKQILHLGIQPANMLLQDDWLLLTDFGMAKVFRTLISQASISAEVQTSVFQAPEMIEGKVQSASDCYSLAAIAYQLFRGCLPFQSGTPDKAFITQGHDVLSTALHSDLNIPAAIKEVLLQGLANSPEKRPSSCGALIDALEHSWRSPGTTSFGDLAATSLAPRSVARREIPTPMTSGQDMSEEGYVATTLSQPVQTAPLPTRSEKPEGTLGRRKILLRGAKLAVAAVVAGVVLSTSDGLIEPRGQYSSTGPLRLTAPVPLLKLTGFSDKVLMARWDQSGRYLATAGGGPEIKLWDIASALQHSSITQIQDRPLRLWTIGGGNFGGATSGLYWSSDGRKLIAGCLTDRIYVLDVFGNASPPTTYEDIYVMSHNAFVFYDAVCVGPQQDTFTAAMDRVVNVWRFGQTNTPDYFLFTTSDTQEVNSLSWSSDGTTLAAVVTVENSSDPQLFLWPNIPRVKPKVIQLPPRPLPYNPWSGPPISWSPVDPHLLLVADNDIVLVMDVEKEEPVLKLGANIEPPIGTIGGLCWSPDGRYIISTYTLVKETPQGFEYDLHPYSYVWDREKLSLTSPEKIQHPTLIFPQQGPLHHTDIIFDLQWSPDGRYLATASADHTVIIWQMSDG